MHLMIALLTGWLPATELRLVAAWVLGLGKENSTKTGLPRRLLKPVKVVFVASRNGGVNLRIYQTPQLISPGHIRPDGRGDNEALDVLPCRFRAARRSGRWHQRHIPNKWE